MEGSEDFVERYFGSAIVAIEVEVVQVVFVSARGEFAIQKRPSKPWWPAAGSSAVNWELTSR